MKLYYFYTLKALWDGQGKIKMYCGIFKVKQLSGKRPIGTHLDWTTGNGVHSEQLLMEHLRYVPAISS